MDCAYFPDFLDSKANIVIVESSLPNQKTKQTNKTTNFSEVIRVSQSQLIYSGMQESSSVVSPLKTYHVGHLIFIVILLFGKYLNFLLW